MGALTLGQFMGHSSRGGRRNYLKNWKEKAPYSVTVWLNVNAPILALYRHRFIRINRKEVEGRPKVEIWSDQLQCWEDEDVLQEQNFYDRDTGERQKPPRLCGHCIMLNWIHEQVRTKQMDWREPLFKYECDDPTKTVVLHAGGMCGMFANKKLGEDQKRELIAIPKERGGPVYQRGNAPNVAFKQDSRAKLEYAFVVVDNDEPGKGLQVAIESNLLGQKVQEVVANAIKSERAGGDERKGDPSLFPYAIMWEHDASDGVEFSKKYGALRMDKVRLTPAIDKLIREPAPESFTGLATRFNPKTHMANLQRQALVQLPWAQFFGPSIAVWDREGGRGPQAPEAGAGTRVPEVGQPAAAAPAENPDEEVLCGNGGAYDGDPKGCQQVLKMRDPKCPRCGKVYVISADPLPLPPPMRTRSQAEVGAPAPAGPPPILPYGEVDPSDDVPF